VSDCGDDEERATPEGHERQGRRLLLAGCAAFMLVVALGFPGSGCLNPRPEELPSADLSLPNSPETGPEPSRETCDDNPLLGDCELPESDINAAPADENDAPPPGESTGLSDEGAPQPSAPASEAAGGGGGDADAGSDTPADAGAP
jgi:hypothetical protein